MRHHQDVLPIAYGSRGQIKFCISNAQIINLHSFEHNNTKEILGKKDTIQPLLQSREIVQMVDDNDSEIWVIDGKERLDKYCEGKNTREWNMQIGIEYQAINVMV